MSQSASKNKPMLHRWVGLLVALLLLITSIASMQSTLSDPHCAGADFFQFWLVGQAMTQTDIRPANIYDPETRSDLNKFGHVVSALQPQNRKLAIASSLRMQIETFSSPFLYTVFTFGTTGDYEADLARYRKICLFLGLASILYFSRAAGFGWTASLLWMALIIQGCRPFMVDAVVGNVNVLQLFAVAVFLAVNPMRNAPIRNLLAGMILGLLVLFKPNTVFIPILLGFHWVFFAQWHKLIAQATGMLAGGILAVVISLRVFSLSAWTQWINALQDLKSLTTIGVADGNVSMARLITDLGHSLPASVILIAFLSAIIACLISARARAIHAKHEQVHRHDALLVGLGLCLMLVGTELAWVHYFLLTLPIMFILLQSWPTHTPWHTLRGTIVLLCATMIFATPIEYFWPLSLGITAILYFLATTMLIGLACFELATPRKMAEE